MIQPTDPMSAAITGTASYFSRLQQAMTTTEKGKYYRLSYKIKVNNATNVSSSTKRVIVGGV